MKYLIISHLIHLEARLSICLYKLPHRDTDICAIPSNSTRGKTAPPKFASRKILVKDASVRQAKAALNGQSSRVFTSSQIPHCGSCGYSPVQAEVPEASTCPSLSIVDSDTETSPLFGEGTIIKEFAYGIAASYEALIFQISAAEWQDMDMIYKYRKFERQRTLFVDSSQEKKHREKQRKRLAFFLSRHVNWTFQRLLSKVGLRRQPNRARNAPATVLATSSVISGMPRRINSVKCSKVSFQVLPTAQCNKDEELTIIAIQHVFESVACFHCDSKQINLIII